MSILDIFKNRSAFKSVDIVRGSSSLSFSRYTAVSAVDMHLYKALRENIPVIDAALDKTVRLIGGFTLKGAGKRETALLNDFYSNVKVGATGVGLEDFLARYTSDLLTFGNAVAEIIPSVDFHGIYSGIYSLYNADLRDIDVVKDKTDAKIYLRDGLGQNTTPRDSDLILFTALNPPSGEVWGTSVLRGLQFVSSILMKIYETVGKNWEKAGNVRFAVTYKPQNDVFDKAYAKERALSIAKEWSNAMADGASRDFVAVGDVSVKAIGADAPFPDSSVPVREMLEQIISKLGLPPYMLGLSWSSTERMSGEQADILTSELTAYRRLLTPIIQKICSSHLRFCGVDDRVFVEWQPINLRDELSEAQAAYYRARAAEELKERS